MIFLHETTEAGNVSDTYRDSSSAMSCDDARVDSVINAVKHFVGAPSIGLVRVHLADARAQMAKKNLRVADDPRARVSEKDAPPARARAAFQRIIHRWHISEQCALWRAAAHHTTVPVPAGFSSAQKNEWKIFVIDEWQSGLSVEEKNFWRHLMNTATIGPLHDEVCAVMCDVLRRSDRLHRRHDLMRCARLFGECVAPNDLSVHEMIARALHVDEKKHGVYGETNASLASLRAHCTYANAYGVVTLNRTAYLNELFDAMRRTPAPKGIAQEYARIEAEATPAERRAFRARQSVLRAMRTARDRLVERGVVRGSFFSSDMRHDVAAQLHHDLLPPNTLSKLTETSDECSCTFDDARGTTWIAVQKGTRIFLWKRTSEQGDILYGFYVQDKFYPQQDFSFDVVTTAGTRMHVAEATQNIFRTPDGHVYVFSLPKKQTHGTSLPREIGTTDPVRGVTFMYTGSSHAETVLRRNDVFISADGKVYTHDALLGLRCVGELTG